MNNLNKQQTHKIDNVNVNKTVNNIVQQDCIDFMKNNMNNKLVDLTLTDIPYDVVNRKSNGLRNLDKGKADYLTFDINSFLDEIYRVTRKSIIVFVVKNNLVQYIVFLQIVLLSFLQILLVFSQQLVNHKFPTPHL